MANPVLVLIKPLVKAVGKELLKVVGKEVAKTAAGKAIVTELQALNVLRSAVDKKIVGAVAKSLGITPKQLRMVTKALNLTDARKAAVKGKNFIHNVNRFTENPQQSIKQYVKNEVKRTVTKGMSDVLQRPETTKPTAPIENALKLLEGKLKKINVNLSVPKSVWDSIETLDIDDIFEVMEYLEVDFYYTSNNSEPDNPIYLDKEHKGFKQGMEEQDFVAMIEGMLLNGFYSTPVDGIY